VEKIMRVQSGGIPDLELLIRKIEEIERVIVNGQPRLALQILYELVPTFSPGKPGTAEDAGPPWANKDRVRALKIAGQSA